MGVSIYEAVSFSVTKEEWEQVYEETLILVKAFPLACRNYIEYAGRGVLCAVPAEELEEYGRTGWRASMDYHTLKEAEEYYLPRDLIRGREVEPDAGDAMMSILPASIDDDWKDRKRRTYSLWDAKTQGYLYHMYLLAIACLIEDRLGEKAFVYGDITRGQCRKAVKMANQHLEKKIRMQDEKGKPQYKEFIEAIMDSKLHLKEKDTENYWEISPEVEQPYGVGQQFTIFMFGFAYNPKVDRYIPIEEIRTALKKGIGTGFDVDKAVDQYLKKEAAAPP